MKYDVYADANNHVWNNFVKWARAKYIRSNPNNWLWPALDEMNAKNVEYTDYIEFLTPEDLTIFILRFSHE